jgi:hypothetical protein
MILFVALIIFVGIYRLLSNRYKPKDQKKKNKAKPTPEVDMEKEFDDDPVVNPGYSSLKSNIFHKDRYDE